MYVKVRFSLTIIIKRQELVRRESDYKLQGSQIKHRGNYLKVFDRLDAHRLQLCTRN